MNSSQLLFSQEQNETNLASGFRINVTAAIVPFANQYTYHYHHYMLSADFPWKSKTSFSIGFSYSEGWVKHIIQSGGESIQVFSGIKWSLSKGNKFVFNPFLHVGYSRVQFIEGKFNGGMIQLGVLPEYRFGNFGVGLLFRTNSSFGILKYSPENSFYDKPKNFKIHIDGVHFGLNLSYRI